MATGMFSGVPSPNRSVLGAKQLQRPADPYLRQQYPEVYGALGGFMGMAPDEMSGSIFDPNTARVRAGAEYGFPVGTALQVAPLAPMLATGAKATARALGPTAVGMGERYLQSRGLMPGVVEGESIGMLGGPIKPQAPVSELGFYSATEQAALNLPRKSGTGESFLNDLMKGQDVKKDELSWLGLDDYLKGKPNVTRQEVQDFIASNRVDVRERQLGGVLSPEMQTTRDALADKYKGLIDNIADAKSQYDEGIISYAELRNTVQNNRVQTEALDSQINEINKTITPTKHPNWQLPGGENYREILLTLPANASKAEQTYMRLGDLTRPLTATEQLEYGNARAALLKETTEGSKTYRSSHFNEPNILAHMRVNDRVDADGKKMLLIEEIQSDWHQAGREKGYAGENQKALLKNQTRLGEIDKILATAKYTPEEGSKLLYEQSQLAKEYGELEAKRARGGDVPDAPFKDTWHQLALKRALKYAADNGYDRVGLTTGRQQVDRYTNEMRQNVDELQFFPIGNQNNILISAKKGGKQTFSGTVADGKFIDGPAEGKTVTEVLGKSMAKQIAEKKDGVIKGDDLTIGGEGMKAYYDEIYPAFLAKQGKKYNAKTGETIINSGKVQSKDELAAQVYGRGMTYRNLPSEQKRKIDEMGFGKGAQSIRYIDISPEMRGGVKKGQPLFTAAPIGGIGLGAGTQDNEMPDAVRQYMADPRYSDPFADTTR